MPQNRTKAVTLGAVAEHAGVSLSTASKALNGRPDVSESTRERVMAAANELEFSPNPLARGLLSGRTGTVGLLTSDLEGRFSNPIMMGAEDAFGMGSTSIFLSDGRGDPVRERFQLQALLARHVDGLIIVGAKPDPRPSLGRSIPVPVVYAYAPSEDPQDCSLMVDNRLGGRIAAEHLVNIGRRRIGVITGDPDYGASHERVAGALDAFNDAGIKPVMSPLFGAWSEASGRGGARVILDAHPDVDALLCGSDQIARGALDVLREKGRSIPDDVAVVGYDNWEVLATNARPPLTTVDLQLEKLGREAANKLMQAIEGRATPGVTSIAPRLVVRGSTLTTS
jgi:LacI family transcriptional regulator